MLYWEPSGGWLPPLMVVVELNRFAVGVAREIGMDNEQPV
jgi:hypothetical protein